MLNLNLKINCYLGLATIFNDVKLKYQIKKLNKVERNWWYSANVKTWFIIAKVSGSIPFTCNMCMLKS
jgi:hypothetical protein